MQALKNLVWFEPVPETLLPETRQNHGRQPGI